MKISRYENIFKSNQLPRNAPPKLFGTISNRIRKSFETLKYKSQLESRCRKFQFVTCRFQKCDISTS